MRHIRIILVVIIVAAFTVPALINANKFTRANWVQSVGFAVDKNPAGFSAGGRLDSSNVESASSILPDSIKLLIKKYNLKIWMKNYKPVVPSNGFIEATNRYYKQVKLTDTGNNARKKGIHNYVAGLPFPKPKNGLEVAWNYQYGYNGDDADNDFAVYWIHAKRGVEKHEEWRWLYLMRAMHRTDIEPIPEIPKLAKKQIQYYSMTVCKKPFDKKGFTALYYRVEKPLDQEGWIYIPAQRRATRFSFGTRGDAWNNTDLLYEDVRGYMGYPEWMHWKIIGKGTFLAPMHSDIPYGKSNINKVYDFNNPPHWNFKANWEPRPMYVVEAKPKFRDYPYSRMICYIDAENYYMMFKEAYDKKNQLWKIVINAFNDSPDETRFPLTVGTSLVVDLHAEHATAFPWFSCKLNVGLDPDQFSLTSLRKLGR